MCVRVCVLKNEGQCIKDYFFMLDICRSTARDSVAEVTMSRLLEVVVLVLDSLANAVLALNGVTRHVVRVGPGLGLLDAGQLCHF